MICSGIYTALITPFDSKGSLDIEGLQLHIQRQKEGQVDGLLVLGTTGEASTLTEEEKKRIIQIARSECPLPLMVGCGSFSTTQTIHNIKEAARLGADYALVITPYYNKPTQEGVFHHFKEVCEASPLPIIIYNNPSRTGVHVEVETLTRLAAFPNIIGVKETSGALFAVCDILHIIKRERPEFAVFCGDDLLAYPMMALGCDGVISGSATLIPQKMKSLVHSCLNNEYTPAQKLNSALFPLFKALLLETNPIPLKAALCCAGLPSGSPRLPLTPLNAKYQASFESVIRETLLQSDLCH